MSIGKSTVMISPLDCPCANEVGKTPLVCTTGKMLNIMAWYLNPCIYVILSIVYFAIYMI